MPEPTPQQAGAGARPGAAWETEIVPCQRADAARAAAPQELAGAAVPVSLPRRAGARDGAAVTVQPATGAARADATRGAMPPPVAQQQAMLQAPPPEREVKADEVKADESSRRSRARPTPIR